MMCVTLGIKTGEKEGEKDFTEEEKKKKGGRNNVKRYTK
jgi:hypothetical protein